MYPDPLSEEELASLTQDEIDEIEFWDSVMDGLGDEKPYSGPKASNHQEAIDDPEDCVVTVGVPWHLIDMSYTPMSRRNRKEVPLDTPISIPWDAIGDSNSMSRKRNS